MLPSSLLMHRYRGEEIEPKRLSLNKRNVAMAQEIISIFQSCLDKRRGELDEALQVLEGEETNYRIKRGLAHLLTNGFCTFETVSPLEPSSLREQVFAASAKLTPGSEATEQVLEDVATALSQEQGREVTTEQLETGLYADLLENQILTSFDAPSPDTLIYRYNLSQVQGILYRASELVITAHRNVPGQYKLLFRYLKLFRLMTYIEGDVDHGFTLTIDGPASLFKQTTKYGTDLAKFLPALLHVSKWDLVAELVPRQTYDGMPPVARFTLDSTCGLVSHYKKGKVYDSIVEQAFVERWAKLDTDWKLEREVELVPIPGSVMIPDFRLVHPNGRSYILEIVGYWRPEYLKKKFAQVRKSERDDIILVVSERLNLAGAGVKIEQVPARVVWFKGKIKPKDVLAVVE